MSDQAVTAVASPVAEKPTPPPKKAAKAAAKPKKPKELKTHPRVSDMVVNAIKTLKERVGSSLHAIKRFLVAQYKVDVKKLSPIIKKFLKSAVAKGQLLQIKGKDASGSFKLPTANKKEAAPKKPKVVKTAKVAAKPKAPRTHPPVSDMVVNAIKTLKKPGGSSLHAIKKFLVAQYKVDVKKLSPFIKKFLKSAVAKGQLLQPTGRGASGSFKLQ